MKKYLLILAAAMFTLAACNKEPEQKGGDNPSGENYEEITLSCSVDLMAGVETTDYGTATIVMPGAQILDFFDMTAEEFYTAMGTFEGEAPNTTQIDNTIQFGVCTGNDHDQMNFCPSSSNNFGCWFNANSEVTLWANEDSQFYTESVIEWGLEDPEDLSEMWNFAVGFRPDHENNYVAGNTVKHTYFFLKEAEEGSDDKDLYCYVEMIFNIVEPQAFEPTVKGTDEQTFTVDFDEIYTGYEIKISKAVGQLDLSSGAVKVYGVNADGTYSAGASNNFWFDQDGNLGNWGDGAGICINDDSSTGNWTFCLMPDESNIGKTLKGAVAFYNDNNEAYIIKLTVNVNAWPTEFTYDLAIDPTFEDYLQGFVPNVQSDIRRILGKTDEELASVNFVPAPCILNESSNDTWYKINGEVTDWENGQIYVGPYENVSETAAAVEFLDPEDLTANDIYAIAYGHYPGHVQNGDKLSVDYVISADGTEITYHLNFTCIAIDEVLDLSLPTSAAWRVGFFENAQTNLLTAFGLDLQGFLDANAAGQIEPQFVQRHQSNDFWYDAAGEITSWGAGNVIYIGGYYDCREANWRNPEEPEGDIWDYEAHDFDFGIAYGVMPGALATDVAFTVFYTITYTPEEGEAKSYTYQVNFSAYEDAE